MPYSYKIAAKNKSRYGYAPMVAKLFVEGASMVQAFDEVNKFTNKFLSKWHVQLEQHRQAIEEVGQQTAASPSSVDCFSCSIGASSPATTIPVHQVGSAQHYSSKPPSRSPPLQAHYCAPSQPAKICQAFSTHIIAHPVCGD